MADRIIDTPHGSIDITINLTKAKDGNKALAEARDRATAQAREQGRSLAGDYGTRREGDELVVVFPLKAV